MLCRMLRPLVVAAIFLRRRRRLGGYVGAQSGRCPCPATMPRLPWCPTRRSPGAGCWRATARMCRKPRAIICRFQTIRRRQRFWPEPTAAARPLAVGLAQRRCCRAWRRRRLRPSLSTAGHRRSCQQPVDIAARNSATCTLQTACILAPMNQVHEAADAADREVNWALLTDTTWSAEQHLARPYRGRPRLTQGHTGRPNFQGPLSAIQAQGAEWLGTAF